MNNLDKWIQMMWNYIKYIATKVPDIKAYIETEYETNGFRTLNFEFIYILIFKKNPSSIRHRLLTNKQNATTFTRNMLNKNCNQFCEISQLTEVKSCFQQWAHANIHAQKKIRQRNRKCSHYAEDSVLKYLILEY